MGRTINVTAPVGWSDTIDRMYDGIALMCESTAFMGSIAIELSNWVRSGSKLK